MRKIFVIAHNTFRETIRDRILYAIFAFAVLFIVASAVVATLSLGEDLKIIRDFGLAGVYIFSSLITIFLGASLIYKEIDQRTLYLVFSKPISRPQYIVGKFFGLFASAALVIILMTAVYIGVVAFRGGGFDAYALQAILLQLFETGILVALSIFFSTLTTPLASALYAMIVLYAGHSAGILLQYAQRADIAQALRFFFSVLYYVMPNLEKFNARNLAIHNLSVPAGGIVLSLAYAAVYSALFLFLAVIILRKKEL